MRRFVVASHGYMASGMLHTAEMVVGKRENVQCICAYIGEGESKSVEEEVKASIERLGRSDELVVVTDIYGGSVCSAFLPYIDNKKVYLIAGMNLPLLLELFSNPIEDTRELIRRSIAKARASICEPAELLETVSSAVEEF